jgi:hypothetical protein
MSKRGKKIIAVVNESVSVEMTATITSRYSFTSQFILGAKYFAEQAAALEQESGVTENVRMQHQAYVAAAIMQSTAALESEVWQITRYGPGQHLGSNETDLEGQRLLDPIKDEIDSMSVLRRFEVILHLLGKEPVDRGSQTYEQTSLLVRLRNELTHYKSKSGPEMDGQKLFTSLKQLGHKKPPFARESQNFFPALCLSAECAGWAWRTADAFLSEFSIKLGKASVLDGYRDRL